MEAMPAMSSVTLSEDAEFGNAVYDAIYEWKDDDFTVDHHLTRRVAQVLMDQGYRKHPRKPSVALETARAETEHSLIVLEAKIDQAKRDAAEIRKSGDKSQYVFADMYERWSQRAQLLANEIRSKYKCPA